MKTKYGGILALFGLSFALAANGQTNTFPPSGNVGIGTISPSFIRDSGGLNITGSYPGLMLVSAGVAGAWELGANYTGSTPFFEIYDSTSSAPNGKARFRIDSSGNIGLGPMNDSTVAGDAPLYVDGTNDRVGIGTTTPAEKLHILSSGNTVFRLDSGFFGTGYGASRFVGLTSGNGLFFSQNLSSVSSGRTGTLDDTSKPGEAMSMGQNYSGFAFMTYTAGSGSRAPTVPMFIEDTGNVGIGTTTPDQALAVNGTIHAKEVIVDDSGWPDWEFATDHRLTPLNEIERTIRDQKHLPGMPSAKEVAAHGVKMGEMQSKLLAQIEELTLHAIAQEKRQIEEETEIRQLEKKVQSLACMQP